MSSSWPTYPEHSALPPSPRRSLYWGFVAWAQLKVLQGVSLETLSTYIVSEWYSFPWPSERLATLGLVVVVVWLAFGGIWRAL